MYFCICLRTKNATEWHLIRSTPCRLGASRRRLREALRPRVPVVGVAGYRADQWQRLRLLAADAHGLHDIYVEWEAAATERLADLRPCGMLVQPVLVDIDQLAEWCHERHQTMDGKACSEFVADKVQERGSGRHDRGGHP
jgi:hypothetical protein